MLDSLKLNINNILPKKLLTEFAGWFANLHAGLLTKLVIDIFIWFYKIDMNETNNKNTSNYKCFNDFFVRPLKNNARPINNDNNVIVIPVDGIIKQFGYIKNNQILQAKGYYYKLEEFLAEDEELIKIFNNSIFVTTYLAPNNYHRVHMPCNGFLRKMIYVPGSLYSLSNVMINNISNIFSRNERVICYFETEFGPILQILIGAIIVGSIETVWEGTIIPPRNGIIKKWHYPKSNSNNSINLLKGQEMGRFKLGSTVINLFSSKNIKIFEEIKKNKQIRFGEKLATYYDNK